MLRDFRLQILIWIELWWIDQPGKFYIFCWLTTVWYKFLWFLGLSAPWNHNSKFFILPNRTRNNSDRNPPEESTRTHGENVPKFRVHNLTSWHEPGILEHFPREIADFPGGFRSELFLVRLGIIVNFKIENYQHLDF